LGHVSSATVPTPPDYEKMLSSASVSLCAFSIVLYHQSFTQGPGARLETNLRVDGLSLVEESFSMMIEGWFQGSS